MYEYLHSGGCLDVVGKALSCKVLGVFVVSGPFTRETLFCLSASREIFLVS